MKKYFYVIITGLFFFGNWMLDIGNNQYHLDQNGTLINGFWGFDALAAMHLGWYLSLFAFLVLIFYSIKLENEFEYLRLKRRFEWRNKI